MDQSTTSMLDAIDKRIAKLRQIRSMIIEEFGQPVDRVAHPSLAKRGRKRKPRPQEHVQAGGRKTQLHDWLKEHGPATRSEIINGTGLPEGTVGGYLSSEKELFENRAGKWFARML